MADALTVLIIDDNLDDREHYIRALRSIPDAIYRYQEASGGEAALDLIASRPFGCVLLDYSLPGMNGLELLKVIRQQHPFLPVILLTGQGNETVAVEAIKHGAQDYLIKASDIQRLHYAIGMAVKQGRMQGDLADTERRLRESDALKSAVLANAKHMIVATDANGIITVFNHAAECASGYTATEVIGKKTPAIWHDTREMEKRAEALRAELGMPVAPGFDVFARKAALRGVDENEWMFVCENGAHFPVNVTVTPIRNDAGAITGYLCVLEDITKRKEMERMKSEFISVVSHELRTPLTSIRGSLGLIVGAMSGDLPEKVAQLLAIANKNSGRLMQLINDILDIDRVAAGEMHFDIQRELLARLMQRVAEANRAYAEKFRVTVEIDPVAPDLCVDVDAERFVQVLSNLLSNAVKFSPEGDKVRVSAVVRGEKIRVHVQDRGPGIPDKFRARMFEKFSQADSSVTRAKGGSGLGLHIAKIMVERMKGEIGYDTVPGKGAIFWIEFPAAVNAENRINLKEQVP